MKIGIIGAGFVGRAIAGLAVAHGHQVMISNSRGPQTLFSLRPALGCEIGTAEEAAAFGDIAVAAVPLLALKNIPVAPLQRKVVLDANNYYFERDGHIPALDRQETTTSEMLAGHLPQSHIVKAFNAIPMMELERDARPVRAPDRRALPLAGDYTPGKTIAAELYEAFGFDAVDAGPLAEGWRFQRGMPSYCVWMNKGELERALAQAVRPAPVTDAA